MALVRLRGPLKRLAGDRSEHAIDGASVGELLAALERAHPAAKRLDPRRARHAAAAHQRVRERRAAASRTRRSATDDRIDVLPAISGGDAMTELLVGTKKGLFVLEGEPGGAFEVTARAFAGEPVEYAMRDPRSGRMLASVTSPFYGPKIWYTDDPAGEWEQAEGVALPEGGDAALERIWVIVPGEADGTLYAGGDPGRAVREPRRRRQLRAQPRRCGSTRPGRAGSPAPAGCACTRSRRGRASRTGSRSAISAAGVWLTDDGGADLAPRQRGARRALPARGRAGRRDRAVRAPHPARAAAAGADLHAVPRRRLPLRRRGRVVERHRAPACRRTSASRSRSTPPTPTART